MKQNLRYSTATISDNYRHWHPKSDSPKTIHVFLEATEMDMMMNLKLENELFHGEVLITGVAGFIGSNLVRSLIGEGRIVVGIDDLNTLNDANMKLARLDSLGVSIYSKNELTQGISTFQFQQLSLNDELGMRHLFEENNFEQVIHLAAHAGIRESLQYPQ